MVGSVGTLLTAGRGGMVVQVALLIQVGLVVGRSGCAGRAHRACSAGWPCSR